MINAIFYDIESLYNIFTIAMFTDNEDPKKQVLDIYYLPDNNKLIIDDTNKNKVAKAIKDANHNFTSNKIYFHNLKTDDNHINRKEIFKLAKIFGVSTAKYINDPNEKSIFTMRKRMQNKQGKWDIALDKKNNPTIIDPFRITCDTDPEWINEKDENNLPPYFLGYNSYNYDTTMLAYFFSVVICAGNLKENTFDETDDEYGDLQTDDITAYKLRMFNNTLFEDAYKSNMPEALKASKGGWDSTANLIRKNMMMSGRHLDVARLNEKQSKVALKRLLGMLGYQILESDKVGSNKNDIKNIDEFADVLAYNASDVFNLKMLFYHPQYQGQFELKRALLTTYPQVVYLNKDIKVSNNYIPTANMPRPDYEADISPNKVRPDRLTIDSSSAQFSTKALCPYDDLKGNNINKEVKYHPKDDRVVSFLYPDKREVEEQQELFDAGNTNIIVPKQKDILDEAQKFFNEKFKDFPKLRAKFDLIYQYYDWIRGKNFNTSASYIKDYKKDPPGYVECDDKALNYQQECIKFFENENEKEFADMVRNADKITEAKFNKNNKGRKIDANFKNERNASIENDRRTTINDIISDYEHKYDAHDLNELIIKAPNFIGKAYDEKGNVIETVPFSEQGTCIPYFNKYGEETSCFVLFSTGGIHGAEYNVELFNHDMNEWQQSINDLNEVKTMFDGDAVAARKERKFTLSDGREISYTAVLKNGLKISDSQWKDLESKRPKLFTEDKKGYSLNKKYTYTSAGDANHEDFASYYPNLLRKMWTFYNEGLNYDRYEEIFNQKSEYGKFMKDKSLSEEDRNHYRVMREGTKLILNSASGAANARFDNNIRNDNQIIAMRCIGQLFSWMIGQAAAYEGALVPSTNTDGLYTFMDENKNNEILETEAKSTGVEIEAERIYLISKDANNRIEYEHIADDNVDENGNKKEPKILAANGGTVGCYKGPNPSKNLAHPAIIDWALTEYLLMAGQKRNGLSLSKPFDREIGMNILLRGANLHPKLSSPFEPVLRLMMFQNIIASSSGSHTYMYGTMEKTGKTKILQPINRMFIMKETSDQTMNIQAAVARKVTPAMRKTRAKENIVGNLREQTAITVLKANGEDIDVLNAERDIVSKKCTGIEPEWHVLIDNSDLHLMSQIRFNEIMNNLDLEKYLDIVESSYMNNWKNNSVEEYYANPNLNNEGEDDGETRE